MRNPFAFMKYRIYRRTFSIYIAIMLFVICSVSGSMLYSAHRTGLERFVLEENSNFSVFEMKRQNVMTEIDRMFFRIYATQSLEDDFIHFFSSETEEYVRYRLSGTGTDKESYPEAVSSLVAESGYCIRYVLHDTSDYVIAAEFNAQGYSRYRWISHQEASELEEGMLVYPKEVSLRGSEREKVTFLIDLSDFSGTAFQPKDGGGVYYYTGGRGYPFGDRKLPEASWEELLSGASSSGSVRQKGKSLFYWVQSSLDGEYTVAVVSLKNPYLYPSLHIVVGIIPLFLFAFVYITFLYGHQFTKDTRFIQKILDSMNRAQSSDFTPIDLEGREDEYGQIASNLNSLYKHLELLIQQKYILTINQQRTEMKMLSAQLNPHFLYNTLEKVRMRALREGAPHAAQAAASLGQLYRNIVKTEPVISLKRELEITEQYLELMTFLCGDQVLYHLDLDNRLDTMLTPKIWMQPILENFFKHNLRDDEQIKVVVVQTRKRKDGIAFDFFDNIGSVAEQTRQELNRELTPSQIRAYAELSDKGIGLQNVYLRLYLYYGERVSMEMLNNQPTGVRIRILIKDEERDSHVQAFGCG